MKGENSPIKTKSDFLKFKKDDFILLTNCGTKCSNFNNNIEDIHLSPYYFCAICKKILCYNCANNHLLMNKDDIKHDSNCIISEEIINQTNIKLFKELLLNESKIFTIYESYKKEIEKEINDLSSIKNLFLKIINDLDNYYKNKLCELNTFLDKENNSNSLLKKDLSTYKNTLINQIKNGNKNYNLYFNESLNLLSQLNKIKNILKQKYDSTSKEFFQKKQDIIYKKDEIILQLISNLREYNVMINDIKNKKDEKLLNIKRIRNNEEKEETKENDKIINVLNSLNNKTKKGDNVKDGDEDILKNKKDKCAINNNLINEITPPAPTAV